MGEESLKTPCMLGSSDNLFGVRILRQTCISAKQSSGATIFGYVYGSKRFGVVEFDDNFNAISIEEKPSLPKSNRYNWFIFL